MIKINGQTKVTLENANDLISKLKVRSRDLIRIREGLNSLKEKENLNHSNCDLNLIKIDSFYNLLRKSGHKEPIYKKGDQVDQLTLKVYIAYLCNEGFLELEVIGKLTNTDLKYYSIGYKDGKRTRNCNAFKVKKNYKYDNHFILDELITIIPNDKKFKNNFQYKRKNFKSKL